MFFATYKNTLKTLVRSALLWIVIAMVIFVAMEQAAGERVRQTVLDENFRIVGYISDLDPEYVLTYDKYIQTILNGTKAWVMLYAIPIFCVISTTLVLNRDFGDSFFEIEKARGTKASKYFLGRLTGLLTVSCIVCLFITFLCVHYYYFSRGGVDSFTLLSYFADSTIRILRVFFCAMLPALLFYIGLTYICGCVIKSGFAGAVIGLGHVLLDYGSKAFLVMRFPEVYHDFISPKPNKLYQYWTFYDTEWFGEKTMRNPFTNGQMLLCTSIIVGAALLYFTVSFICTKRRSV